jgi:hypothetical protein
MTTDPDTQRTHQTRILSAAIRRLHEDGWRIRDIARAMQLNDSDVSELLKLRNTAC